MSEEKPQVFDITKPAQVGASATSRPIIAGYEPTSDPMVTPTQLPAVFSQTPSAPVIVQSKVIPISVIGAEGPAPAPTAAAPLVIDPPMQSIPPAVPAQATVAFPDPEPIPAPPVPGPAANAALTSDALQSKINNHPLFSGTPDTPPIKNSKIKKILLWTFIVLLLAAVGGYLAVDYGLVRGASHLPFHIFKKATPMSQPVIKTQTTPAFSYASWQNYSNTATGFMLKYPADWKFIPATKGTNPTDDTFKPTSATALPNIYIENGATKQTDAATYWSQEGSGRAGTVLESKTSTINGYPAYYVVTTLGGSKLYTYAIVYNGKGININLEMDTTDTTSLDILTKVADSIAFN